MAVEYYLKDYNQKVTKKNIIAFDKLPTTNQTVLLLGQHQHFSPSQQEMALNWVKKGGHLIVEINHNKHQEDPKDNLLNPLGIYLIQEQEADSSQHTELHIEGAPEPAIFDFSSNFSLEDTHNQASFFATDKQHNIHLLQMPLGKGKLTVISDGELWKNHIIHQHDHAWLLHYLTKGQDVTIVYNPFKPKHSNHPNYLLTILKNYPYSSFILALFIIALLWYKGTRSGPLEKASSKHRRRLPEQLLAQANFLYKKTGPQQLIKILQQDIYYLVKKRHPRFEDYSTEEQYALISKLTQQPVTTISQVMDTTEYKQSQIEFTKTVIALQAIRNAL